MEIKVYATLRPVVGGSNIQLEATELTVEQMLQTICTQYPGLRPKIFTANTNQVNPSMNILINGRDMRYLNGMATLITLTDDVRIFPPVGGGR